LPGQVDDHLLDVGLREFALLLGVPLIFVHVSG
jgi:hypothetical protein